jgi:hypothetical protein
MHITASAPRFGVGGAGQPQDIGLAALVGVPDGRFGVGGFDLVDQVVAVFRQRVGGWVIHFPTVVCTG